MKNILLYILILLICLSCVEKIVDPDFENTPINNFNILWEDYDRHYSRFIYKGVNWDSIYDVYSPLINNNLTHKKFLTLFLR